MRKIFIMFLLVGLLAGCGNSDLQTQYDALQADYEELQDEYENMKSKYMTSQNELNKYKQEEEHQQNLEKLKEQENEKWITVDLNEKVTLDFCEFAISTPQFDDFLYLLDDTAAGYRPEEGNKFFSVRFTCKNTYTKYIDPENMYAQIIVDDKYEYDALVNYAYLFKKTIDPLEEGVVFLCKDIPASVADSYQTITVRFGFRDNFEGGPFLDEPECTYRYQVVIDK